MIFYRKTLLDHTNKLIQDCNNPLFWKMYPGVYWSIRYLQFVIHGKKNYFRILSLAKLSISQKLCDFCSTLGCIETIGALILMEVGILHDLSPSSKVPKSLLHFFSSMTSNDLCVTVDPYP